MDKQPGMFMEILPLLILFVVGTAMILTLGFFLINYMSATASVTGYSIFGQPCPSGNCGKINAGVMAIIILALVIFQYVFYRRYRKKSGR